MVICLGSNIDEFDIRAMSDFFEKYSSACPAFWLKLCRHWPSNVSGLSSSFII